jgi:hypothetical protein
MKKPAAILAILAVVGALALGLAASHMPQALAAVDNLKQCAPSGPDNFQRQMTSTSSSQSFTQANTFNQHTHLTNLK